MEKVFVVGLPKSGTTSLDAYFKCNNISSSHQICDGVPCALCIRRNLDADRPPLFGCNRSIAYTQLDWEFSDSAFKMCFFPQRDLRPFHEHYPFSTFVLNLRPALHWINSVNNWGTLRERLRRCNLTQMDLTDDANMIRFYNEHTKYVRQFAREHSHRLVEVDIESSSPPFPGAEPKCYAQRNSNKHDQMKSATTCFIGDNLLRFTWCYAAHHSIDDCVFHEDRQHKSLFFFWRPTLASIRSSSFSGCSIAVWNNLYHEVRTSPEVFIDVDERRKRLDEAYAHLRMYAARVIFYASDFPSNSFASETHSGISMRAAWEQQLEIVNTSTWLSVRADLMTQHVFTRDGRHYDNATVGLIYRTIAPLLEVR